MRSCRHSCKSLTPDVRNSFGSEAGLRAEAARRLAKANAAYDAAEKPFADARAAAAAEREAAGQPPPGILDLMRAEPPKGMDGEPLKHPGKKPGKLSCSRCSLKLSFLGAGLAAAAETVPALPTD